MQFITHFLLLLILSGSLPVYAVSQFKNSVQFSCVDANLTIQTSGAATVSDGSTSYYIGYHQATGINQNPIVRAIGTNNWCKDDYETGGPDSKGLGLLFDATNGFYVAMSVDGGDGAGTGLEQHTGTGWLSSYGSGGGPAVSVILKLDPANGTVLGTGTYVIAKLSSGNTNSLKVKDMSFNASNQLVVRADSYFLPLNPDKTRMTSATGNSPFDYTLVLEADLTGAISSSVNSSSGDSTTTAISASVYSPVYLLLLSLILISLVKYRHFSAKCQ